MDQMDNASLEAVEITRANEEALITQVNQEALNIIRGNEDQPHPHESDCEFPVSDEEGPLVEDEAESSGGEEIDVAKRKRIRPFGDSFKNSKKVMPIAYSFMKGLFTGAWIRWNQVPPKVKDIWFDGFKAEFFWKDKHSQAVRRNWAGKCSQHLRYRLKKARESGEKPSWITQTIWSQMLIKWDDDDFKSKCESNKSHRACLKGGYCGGSKSTQEHVSEFKKKNNRRITQAQLMRKLFRKKKTGEWAGSKPPAVIDRYNESISAFKETHPEGMTEEDKKRLWAEAAGVNSKGQMYAQGSLKKMARDFRNPGVGLPSSTQSMNPDANQMEDLRKSIEDDVRKSLEVDLRRTITEQVHQQLTQARQQEEVLILQARHAQQMQRYTQTGQPTQHIDPMLQTEIPLTTLLSSAPNPLMTYPPVQSSVLAPVLGANYMPPGYAHQK